MKRAWRCRVFRAVVVSCAAAAVPTSASAQTSDAQKLCALVGPDGSSARPPNEAGGKLKDAVVDQVKNLVWAAVSKGGGNFEAIGETADKADDALFDPLI